MTTTTVATTHQKRANLALAAGLTLIAGLGAIAIAAILAADPAPAADRVTFTQTPIVIDISAVTR